MRRPSGTTTPPTSAALTRRGVLALGAAAALPLAGAPGSAEAAEGGTLRMAFASPVATLDPAKFRVGGMEYNYAYYVFNRLTYQNAKLEVQPDLALSWESTPDLKSWTFKLRPNVKFHNGKAFDASDVLFTYSRLQDKTVGSVLRAALDIVTKIEAVDPLTVKFTLSIPYADLPAVVAGYQSMIVTESAIATVTTKPIGTGPFKFVEYKPGDQMVIEKNPDYFVPGVPKVDRVILRVIPEFTTAVAGLESGSIDIIYDLPPEQSDKLAKSTVASVIEIATGGWNGLIFNNAYPPFDNPKVRAAFMKIVDKPTLTDIATFGHGTPTVTPIPPSHPYFRKDLLVAQDLPGAKKMLTEAKFDFSKPLQLYVPGQSPSFERLGIAFRDAAKQIGINIELTIVPADKFFAEMEGKVPFNVDNFFGRTTPDLMLYAWYHSSGSWNQTLWNYKNAEVDSLLEKARTISDKAEQAKLYGRFQEIVAVDGPGSVVFVTNFAVGISKKIKGVATSPLMFIDITNVTLT